MFKRPSLILVEKSRRTVLRSKPREAILGDSTGNIYAGDGKYYARWPGPADENGNATYSPCFSVFGGGKNFIEQANRRVYVKQNHKGQWEIDGAVYEDLLAAGIKPSAMHPNNPYRQFQRLDDIQNFKAIPLSKTSMKVRIGELFYVDRNGIPRWFPGSVAVATASNPAVHVDLTSYKPATTDYECFATISFNQDDWALGVNPLEVSVSTAQTSIPSTLGIADVQEAFAGMAPYAMPIKTFRLYNGMTGLKGDPADLEGRQFINVPLSIASLSPLTTKGDLFTYSTLNTRLPLGTNGQVLTVDTSTATGLKYATPAIGIDQLTGDVTAGPGSGSQVATIANNAITQAKMADASVGTNELIDANVTDAKIVSIAASKVTGVLGVDHGGSGADMSATGGANFLVKQTSVGGAFTAALMVLADIPNLLITGAKIALATIGLTNLANGTPFRFMGWDSTGAAAELDGALDTTGATGESWAAKDNLYLDSASNTWFKIDVDAVPIKIGPIRGVALTAATHPASGQRIRREGIVTGYSSLTPGLAVWADYTAAGASTQTKPSVDAGSGQICVCQVGYAITATTVFVDKDKPIEYLKREFLDDNDTMAITHHADPEGRTRDPSAYLTSNTEVIKEQYTSSDTDAPLRRRSTGSTVTVDATGVTTTALGDTGGTDIRMTQKFEVGTTGYVSTIAISTGATTGAPSAFPSYRIETKHASLDIPSGVVVANSSGTLGSWTASGTTTITYTTTTPYLTTGVPYFFILELPLQANNNFYTVIRNTGGGYASGMMIWDSTTGASFPGTWANGGGTNDMRVVITTVIVNDMLGQGMTLASPIDVTRVELYLKRTGALSGNLQVLLYLGSGGGTPVAPSYASEIIAALTVGTSAAYVEFAFTVPASLTAAEWFIVLTTTDTQSATAYLDWLVDTSSPGYSGGVLVTLRNTTWANASPAADARFILYGVGTYYNVPVVVGEGSTMMEVHYGDGSFANQDTITTWTNVSGFTLDFSTRVRMDT